MEETNLSDDSLSISDVKLGGPIVDDGTYEAAYTGLEVGMGDSKLYGPKKYAKLHFDVQRGKFRGRKLSFRNNFVQDPETQQWVVGSKSKLADAIRTITGGQNLNKSHIGTTVFITVKNEPSKKGDGKVYSYIVAIIPKPSDEDGDTKAAVAAPAARQATVAPAVKIAPKPAVKSEGLLDDLTELSDFKE